MGLLRGLLSYRGQEEREMGFRAVLDQEAPGLKVAVLERGQSKDDSAESRVLQAVSCLPGLCAIYSMAGNNSEIAAALVAAGRTDIVLIGHDLTPGTRASLLSGVMDAAIVQSPIDEIRQATKTLTAMVRDPTFRSMPPLEHLPIQIVIRESLS